MPAKDPGSLGALLCSRQFLVKGPVPGARLPPPPTELSEDWDVLQSSFASGVPNCPLLGQAWPLVQEAGRTMGVLLLVLTNRFWSMKLRPLCTAERPLRGVELHVVDQVFLSAAIRPTLSPGRGTHLGATCGALRARSTQSSNCTPEHW